MKIELLISRIHILRINKSQNGLPYMQTRAEDTRIDTLHLWSAVYSLFLYFSVKINLIYYKLKGSMNSFQWQHDVLSEFWIQNNVLIIREYSVIRNHVSESP